MNSGAMVAPCGLETVAALVGDLQARHGAVVLGHDVEPDGTVTLDVTLSAAALRSMRAAYRRELSSSLASRIESQRDWTEKVRAHTEAVRRLYEPASG